MELIDVGVNLTNKSLLKDLNGVMERARNAGIRQMVVTGTSIEESRQAVDLCNQYPDSLVSTCGVHPHHASDWNQDSFDELKSLAQQNACVQSGKPDWISIATIRPIQPRKSYFSVKWN
jgi:TatD DNase family protein